MQTNILDTPLQICSKSPVTGFYRDGSCRTSQEDFGSHSVCAQITDAFLSFTKERGNDLSTPRPEFGFEGLKEGDRWCLCAMRWKEAYEAGKAPKIVPEATSSLATQVVDKEILMEYAVKEQ